jgi:hypothetical protein
MVKYLKNKTEKHQKEFLITLICAIILIGVFYIYCVSAIVMETVSRNQNIQTLQVVQKKYQELEKSYLDIISKFNLDYAYSQGFINGNSLAYIPRQVPVAQNSGYDKALR